MSKKSSRQAGKSPEFQITDRMVAAATDVLNDSGVVEVPTMSNSGVAREMLEAAYAVAERAQRRARVSSPKRR